MGEAGARRKFPIIGRCGCPGCCPQALILLITLNEAGAPVSMKHARTPLCTSSLINWLISSPLSHRCWLGTSFDQYGHCLPSERQLEVTPQSIVKYSGILCSRIARGLSAGPQPYLPIRGSSEKLSMQCVFLPLVECTRVT